MSNTSIAERVLEVADKYATGLAPASAIAASLELHLSALEGVPKDLQDRLHALSILVIAEDVSPQEAEELGMLPCSNSISELRRILRQL